ncbi:MAG TPA: alpha/beta fold hydrolase [Terracidiphilus sp.]|nr:alpha/beta fold hydrolase [Terracidiphilus sp.]
MTAAIASVQDRTISADATEVRPPVHRNHPPAAAPRSLRTVHLDGPAGRLEALLNEGAPDATFAALVCHPHPLGGGNLHNKVVYHAMKALNDSAWGLGMPVLRFNFRGTGLSEGDHDGEAEVDDVLACLKWLENAYNLPVVAAGFSFGAVMALKACSQPARTRNVRALAALGLPIEAGSRKYLYPFLKNVFIPKLFISGDRDQFAPVAHLQQVVASAADPKNLVFLPGADHFLSGQLEPMQQVLSGWLKEQLV